MYIFLLICFALIIAVPIATGFLIDRFIQKRGYHQAFRLLALTPIIIFGYFVYDAIFPSESFYREEFELATNIDFPTNSKILFKSATYPDIHGEYSSVVCFKTSQSNYDKLLEEIMVLNDTSSFKPLSQFEKHVETLTPYSLSATVLYTRKNIYYNIGFLSDKRTIILCRFGY